MIESVLIANRGEIAVRIARACRDLGVRSVAVYSDADAGAEHVRIADSAVHLGPPEVRASYLSIDRLMDAARRSDAAAVHPGYGLLSENPEFAARVIGEGLVFVGPRPEVIDALGDKRTARDRAAEVGLSVLPARRVDDDATSDATSDAVRGVGALAAEVGYPLLVKAAFGGGGRGMRIVETPDGLADALDQARRENRSAFGRADVYLERFLPRARHVEVQIVRDTAGNVVHLGTRDCTTQRRNQKLIEEAPAFDLPADVADRAATGACRLADLLDYHGAATVEFLFAPDSRELFFLEVNTRVQVEHTVTELVTGVDIVTTQLLIASGDPLPFRQDDIEVRGVAIEARINAEDPTAGFLPQTGTIETLALPGGPWIRVDSGVTAGNAIGQFYDSLLAKVAAWGPDRDAARGRLRRALHETAITGLPTTTGFLARVVDSDQFTAGTHWTGMVDAATIPTTALEIPGPASPAGAPGGSGGPTGSIQPHLRPARIRLPRGEITLDVPVPRRAATVPQRSTAGDGGAGAGVHTGRSDGVAPMDAVLIRHLVEVGDSVTAETAVAVVESMKMETHIRSGVPGVVSAVHGAAGDSVRRGQRLVTVVAVDMVADR